MSTGSGERGLIRPLPLVILCGLLAVLLVVSAAAVALPGRRLGVVGPPTPLGRPFGEFPTDFLPGYNWRHGTLEPEIEKLVGSNATLKLSGANREGWVDVYTSYFGYASTPLEHEPDVCYPAQGWSLPLGVIRTEVDVAGWGRLPISVYYFTKDVQRTLVINYYCINGKYYNDRTLTKFLDDKPGGFYAQTRVTVEVRGDDVTASGYASHPDYLRALTVMRAAAPLVEKHFPKVRPDEATVAE